MESKRKKYEIIYFTIMIITSILAMAIYLIIRVPKTPSGFDATPTENLTLVILNSIKVLNLSMVAFLLIDIIISSFFYKKDMDLNHAKVKVKYEYFLKREHHKSSDLIAAVILLIITFVLECIKTA